MPKLWIRYTIQAYSYFKIGMVLGCAGKMFPDLAGHPVFLWILTNGNMY